jgi:cell wall-associated NlpC family hydrolase
MDTNFDGAQDIIQNYGNGSSGSIAAPAPATFTPKVVTYAESKVGTSFANGYCLKFVRLCFEGSYGFSSSACCANKYASTHVDSTSRDNIPLGADVYFNGSSSTCATCKNKCGHVGIYVGNGYIVHGWNGKIVKTTIDYVISKGYPYRGWGYHGNVVLTN